MPHGSARVGAVEVQALCDGVADYHSPIEVAYPGIPDESWEPYRALYPDQFADSGTWRLHVHCFVVRSGGRTVLVDTGIGPPGAPGTEWFGRPGRLVEEVAEVGVEPSEIDTVLITHLHDDHIGWNVGEDGAPRFSEARYLIPAADWKEYEDPADDEDRAIADQLLRPLQAAGAVDLVDGEVVITDDVLAFHTPGHTPGHQCVFVSSDGDQLLLSGDLTNHPAQLHQPSWAAGGDGDPDLAGETRLRVLDRVGREGIGYSTAHFTQPFGTIRRDGDGWAWIAERGNG